VAKIQARRFRGTKHTLLNALAVRERKQYLVCQSTVIPSFCSVQWIYVPTEVALSFTTSLKIMVTRAYKRDGVRQGGKQHIQTTGGKVLRTECHTKTGNLKIRVSSRRWT
tara:strand:- start:477 stop:806 length:330 start_codon:yes stop_codon:yes gene_type:complete